MCFVDDIQGFEACRLQAVLLFLHDMHHSPGCELTIRFEHLGLKVSSPSFVHVRPQIPALAEEKLHSFEVSKLRSFELRNVADDQEL